MRQGPQSVWSATAKLPEFPSLKGDAKTDILIIGGGMAGLLTAYMLHQRGMNYILVEKDRICGGNTKNTTAKITVQHGLIYHKLMKSGGTELAKLYLEANREAFSALTDLCRTVDCDFEVKDNFVYSLTNRAKLEKELAALQTIGYDAFFEKDLPLPITTAGGIRFSHQGQFHPLKFASSIVRKLNIYEHTFVREMIGNTAVTDHGKIRAKAVAVTTHFPFINKHGSYFLKLYQHRSYVLALENAQNVQGMYVDGEMPGLSFRNYNGMLLLGGGDHRTGKEGGNWNELRSFAKTHYPESTERYFWSAQDCMSLDLVPYIGRYSACTPDLYTATGFNKWGMTGAMLSAMLLTDALTGRTNDYAHIFSPSRSIIKPQLFINGAETVKSLLTISKKRCPHMGCALKWNSAEHSWDCPCHGSRFSQEGKVLDNPSNGDLSQ